MEQEITKIALCLPTGDTVHTDFCISLIGICAETAAGITIVNARTSVIEQSRFLLVREALQREVEYILFIDSDLSFPPDSINRLLAHDKDIVGATYIRRREPYNVLGFPPDDEEILPGQKGLTEMVRMPFGFMLIRTKVFADVPRPWFVTSFSVEDDGWTSEDYKFCDQAIAHGYKIWCDLDLSHELAHHGMNAWWWGKPKEETDDNSK